MLKLTAESLTNRTIAYAEGQCRSVAPRSAAKVTRKYLSQTQTCHKKIVIKDHYEFDQKVINSDKPVIVDFHAEWCDPCKILTPKMVELLQDSNDIDLAVIDVDANTDLVQTFEVKAVPAVIAFRNGVVVDKFIGLADANSIETLIKKLSTKNATKDEENK